MKDYARYVLLRAMIHISREVPYWNLQNTAKALVILGQARREVGQPLS